MLQDIVALVSIILAISFFLILIYNTKLKNKFIKIVFMILAICFLISILVLDNAYVYELLKSIITYFWYPNYLIFVTTILISVIIFIFTLLKKKLKLIKYIKNYLLFIVVFPVYIIYLRQEIDTTLYTSLYSKTSLTLMRIVTISFTIWLIVTIILRIKDRGKKHEK